MSASHATVRMRFVSTAVAASIAKSAARGEPAQTRSVFLASLVILCTIGTSLQSRGHIVGARGAAAMETMCCETSTTGAEAKLKAQLVAALSVWLPATIQGLIDGSVLQGWLTQANC